MEPVDCSSWRQPTAKTCEPKPDSLMTSGRCRAGFVGGSTSTSGNCCPFPLILDEHPDPIYADNIHPACASPCVCNHLISNLLRGDPSRVPPPRVCSRVGVAQESPRCIRLSSSVRHDKFALSWRTAKPRRVLGAGSDPGPATPPEHVRLDD